MLSGFVLVLLLSNCMSILSGNFINSVGLVRSSTRLEPIDELAAVQRNVESRRQMPNDAWNSSVDVTSRLFIEEPRIARSEISRSSSALKSNVFSEKREGNKKRKLVDKRPPLKHARNHFVTTFSANLTIRSNSSTSSIRDFDSGSSETAPHSVEPVNFSRSEWALDIPSLHQQLAPSSSLASSNAFASTESSASESAASYTDPSPSPSSSSEPACFSITRAPSDRLRAPGRSSATRGAGDAEPNAGDSHGNTSQRARKADAADAAASAHKSTRGGPPLDARAVAPNPRSVEARPGPAEARRPAYEAPEEYCDTRPMVCKEFQETGQCRCEGGGGGEHSSSSSPKMRERVNERRRGAGPRAPPPLAAARSRACVSPRPRRPAFLFSEFGPTGARGSRDGWRRRRRQVRRRVHLRARARELPCPHAGQAGCR